MIGRDRSKKIDPSDDSAGRNAASAILVALARSDDAYDDVERARISSALGELFELTPSEADTLRAEGEQAHAAAIDLHQFTWALKRAFTVEERAVYMEAAWRVALADGTRDAEENALMRRLASLIGVGDRASAIARQKAEARQEETEE